MNSTLCLCHESSQLQSPALGCWGCLREALAVLVERPCAYGAPVDVVRDISIDAGPILLPSPVLASSPSPGGLHEGWQGYG